MILATLPALALLGFFHARDLFPEPPERVWPTFLLGMMIFVPILVLSESIYAVVEMFAGTSFHRFAESLLVAAIPEEVFKFVVVTLYAARVVRFRGAMDGIVYGVAASLGFATIENALYVAMGGVSTAALRALTALPCHASLGVILGFCVGRALAGGRVRPGLLLLGLVLPIAAHAAYDYPLFTLSAAQAEPGGLAAMPALVRASLHALFLTVLIGGLILSHALLQRAREEFAGQLDRTARADGPRRRTSLSMGESVARMLLGSALAIVGGWVLGGLAVALHGGIPARVNFATAAVLVLLIGSGVLVYGLHLAIGGIRLPIRQAASAGPAFVRLPASIP